jgi:hypothetical protein
MLHNFGEFCWAVADHWLFWIGLFLMIEPYLERVAPRTWETISKHLANHPERRKKLFRIIGAIALFFACFQAWNVEHTKRTENADRVAMKALVSVGIKEGEALTLNYEKKDADKFKHETNFWTNRIGHLVEEAYGEGESSLLMSDAGYISYTDGKDQTNTRNWILHRLQRLNDLIPRVDTLPLQSSFDAKNYHWADKCAEC